jgi:hypothetical protein
VFSFSERVSALRAWRLKRAQDGPIIGGKHPSLGKLVREIDAAMAGHWKAIVTQRPTIDSARSHHSFRHHRGSVNDIANRLETRIDQRDTDLAAVGAPTLRVDFATMMQDPTSIVEQLISFVGLSPTPEQRAQAVAFVEPKLNHFTEIT